MSSTNNPVELNPTMRKPSERPLADMDDAAFLEAVTEVFSKAKTFTSKSPTCVDRFEDVFARFRWTLNRLALYERHLSGLVGDLATGELDEVLTDKKEALRNFFKVTQFPDEEMKAFQGKVLAMSKEIVLKITKLHFASVNLDKDLEISISLLGHPDRSTELICNNTKTGTCLFTIIIAPMGDKLLSISSFNDKVDILTLLADFDKELTTVIETLTPKAPKPVDANDEQLQSLGHNIGHKFVCGNYSAIKLEGDPAIVLSFSTTDGGDFQLVCGSTKSPLFNMVVDAAGKRVISLEMEFENIDVIDFLKQFDRQLDGYIARSESPASVEKPVDKWQNPACGRTKAYNEVLRSDLTHGDSLDKAISTHLHNIAVYNMGKPDYNPTKEDRDMLIAGYERIEFLHDRLWWFESMFGTAEYTAKQVTERLRAFSVDLVARDDDSHGNSPAKHPIIQLVREYYPEHGLEPIPFVTAQDRRFVNMEWVKWRMAVNLEKLTPSLEERVMQEAGRRTVEMLFPTHEAKSGLSWWVNAKPIPHVSSHNPAEHRMPYEIVIERKMKQSV